MRIANASSASTPPSPLLSKRSTNETYLTDTISVTAQKMSESTPNTLASVSGRRCAPPNASLKAYSGLVPMSPNTTPTAPSVSAPSRLIGEPGWREAIVCWAIAWMLRCSGARLYARPAGGARAGVALDPVPLDELPRDDDPLHLVRPLADAEERRVAKQALDRELLRVAVAAVDPHRLGRVLERGLGGEVLRHPGFHVAAAPAVVGLRRGLGEEPRRLRAGRHLAELELDRLVLADRLAERLAELRIAHRLVERALRDADAACGDVDPAELEPAHREIEALPLLADQVGRGDLEVLEHKLCRVDALVAELLELPRRLEARPLLHHEHRQPPARRLRVGIGADEHGERAALDAVRDPGLGAVDDVAVAALKRARADCREIGATVGFGKGEAAAELARTHLRQPAAPLLVGAELLEKDRKHEVRVEDAGERHPGCRDSADDFRVGG